MEFGMLGRENEAFFGPRTLSDISIASAASGKVQNTSTGSGQMQLDLSLAASKHGHNRKVKFMCSFAGKILPRPSDRKLRYVGGETRMISVPRYIKYAAFLQKLVEIYGPDILLKYQLPDEDLDALVSVSSDEDLENMMEECDKLDSMEGAPRLRVFIFSMTELDTTHFIDVADPKIAEQRYVDAVNAMPSELAAKKYDDLVLADSSRNSDGLDAYTWNAVQSEVPSLGTFQSEVASLEKFLPTSNFLPSKTLLSSPDPHSPPRPMFAAAPPDFFPNHRVNTMNSNETALVADDFVDLECAGSANSSASSQHDLHNKYTNSKWHPSAHLQSPQESATYNGNVEDNMYRIEQRHAEDIIGQNGGLSSTVPLTAAKVAVPHGTATKSEGQPDQLQSDTPLSPGAALQKQLQADRADVLSERFLTGIEQPVLSNGYGQQQNFQPQEILQDQNPWQRHTFYNPLTNLGLEMTGIAHEDPVKDSSHAPHLETRRPSPFTERLQTHQLPAAAVPKDYNSILYSGEGGHISEVPRTCQPIFFEPSDHDLQPLKNFPVTGTMGMSGFPQEVTVSTTKFSNQRILDHNGHELARDAPWHAAVQTSYQDSNLVRELPGERAYLDNLQCNFRNAPDNYSDGQSHLEQPVLPILLQKTEGLQFPIPSLLEEPLASVANYFLATDQVATQNLNRDFSHTAASHAMGEPCTVDMVSQLLQSSRLTDNYSQEAVTGGIVTGRTAEFPGETHEGGKNLNVKAPVESPVASFTVVEPSTHVLGRASRDRGFQPLRESFPSNEDLTVLRNQENVLPYSTAFSDIEDLSDRRRAQMGGDNIPGSTFDADLFAGQMLSNAWETPSAPPPSSTVAAWDSTFSETGYQEQAVALHASREKEADDMDLTLTMENGVAVEDSSVKNEELDAFESVVDKPTSVATTAAAEAIALGLQTIRNCDLEELRELGSGTFGTVFHGKWRGSDVAIKRIKSSCFSGRPPERERLIADFWREACLLGQLHHPNVVAFYGVVPDGPGGTLATVTEYMVNGSLKQVLQKNDRTLDRRKRLLIAMDAAFGMEYLHGKNVVHFDMKCENLLVNLRDTQRPICKVGDLGLSKVKQQTMVSGGVRGTLPWMAPELLNGSSSLVSEKVDVFSFGIVLWELLTGEEPYANMHYGAIIGGIVNNTLRPPVPRWCDPAWKALMERCWSADPSERPTFTEIAGTLRAMEASLHTKGQGPSTSS